MKILIFAGEDEHVRALFTELRAGGNICLLAAAGTDVADAISKASPEIAIVQDETPLSISQRCKEIKDFTSLPVLAAIDREALRRAPDLLQDADDLVLLPAQAGEAEIRLRRLLRHAGAAGEDELVCGDLRIDLAKCEVFVGSNSVVLTYKEYELLKFFVSNQGRVYSRAALLDKVWGYDYYGGDRTVDVHIRRLRSKIEDANHSFIETVRNIGYRFRAEKTP